METTHIEETKKSTNSYNADAIFRHFHANAIKNLNTTYSVMARNINVLENELKSDKISRMDAPVLKTYLDRLAKLMKEVASFEAQYKHELSQYDIITKKNFTKQLKKSYDKAYIDVVNQNISAFADNIELYSNNISKMYKNLNIYTDKVTKLLDNIDAKAIENEKQKQQQRDKAQSESAQKIVAEIQSRKDDIYRANREIRHVDKIIDAQNKKLSDMSHTTVSKSALTANGQKINNWRDLRNYCDESDIVFVEDTLPALFVKSGDDYVEATPDQIAEGKNLFAQKVSKDNAFVPYEVQNYVFSTLPQTYYKVTKTVTKDNQKTDVDKYIAISSPAGILSHKEVFIKRGDSYELLDPAVYSHADKKSLTANYNVPTPALLEKTYQTAKALDTATHFDNAGEKVEFNKDNLLNLRDKNNAPVAFEDIKEGEEYYFDNLDGQKQSLELYDVNYEPATDLSSDELYFKNSQNVITRFDYGTLHTCTMPAMYVKDEKDEYQKVDDLSKVTPNQKLYVKQDNKYKVIDKPIAYSLTTLPDPLYTMSKDGSMAKINDKTKLDPNAKVYFKQNGYYKRLNMQQLDCNEHEKAVKKIHDMYDKKGKGKDKIPSKLIKNATSWAGMCLNLGPFILLAGPVLGVCLMMGVAGYLGKTINAGIKQAKLASAKKLKTKNIDEYTEVLNLTDEVEKIQSKISELSANKKSLQQTIDSEKSAVSRLEGQLAELPAQAVNSAKNTAKSNKSKENTPAKEPETKDPETKSPEKSQEPETKTPTKEPETKTSENAKAPAETKTTAETKVPETKTPETKAPDETKTPKASTPDAEKSSTAPDLSSDGIVSNTHNDTMSI